MAADRGAGLGHFLDGRIAVEPRHQRILEGRRDRQRRQWANQCVPVAVVAQQARFENRLGQLLDEQRHAVGAGNDLVHQFCRQRFAGDAFDHRGALLPVEAIQGHQRHVRAPKPGRRKFRPEGNEAQDRKLGQAIDDQVEQFAEGRVDPVDILDHHQHRADGGQRRQLTDERGECPLLALLRGQVFGRDDRGSAYRQQIGKQSDGLVLRLSTAVSVNDTPQLCKLVLGAIVVLEPGRPLQVPDDRVQGAVLMVRRTEILDADVGLAPQVLRQRRD